MSAIYSTSFGAVCRYPKRLALATTLLFFASSCGKSFVDLAPQNIIPVNNFYKTEADFKAALTGAYANLRPIYDAYWVFAELPSDNVQTYPGSEASFGEFDKLTYQPTTTLVASAWSLAYQTIASVNGVLDRADNGILKEPLKTQLVAEAKALRALMYFNLIRFYGPVPLVLHELKTEAEAYTYLRTSETEVYKQIETDLLDAEKTLPAQFTGLDIGRFTSGAVKALLGKVYLQQKKWPQAAAKLDEVVTSGKYSLLAKPMDAFGPGKDNNGEIVLAVQYMGGGFGLGNTFAHAFGPPESATAGVTIGGGTQNIGTKDLYDFFETGDTRRDAFIGRVPGSSMSDTYYWTKKFVYDVKQQNEGDNDWPVIRYADVILMHAEAINQTGAPEKALPSINAVRKRAGLPELASLSKEQTQLAIEKERRAELCFEGHRWHDLIRWGKEVAVIQAFKDKYSPVDIPVKNISITPDRKLFPIPFRERSLNNQLTQNAGY